MAQAGDRATEPVDLEAVKTQVQDTVRKVRNSISEAAVTLDGQIPAPVRETFRQGPAGIQYFSFGVGLGLVCTQLLQLYVLYDVLFEPASYVLHVYQLLGGLLVALLEMDPDWLANMVQYRRIVNEQAHFLTHLLGRGLFYIALGSVAVCQESVQEQIIGWLIVFVGVAYVAFHNLLEPEEKILTEAYMRSGSSGAVLDAAGPGYRPLLQG
jgi:hypothetical protein